MLPSLNKVIVLLYSYHLIFVGAPEGKQEELEKNFYSVVLQKHS